MVHILPVGLGRALARPFFVIPGSVTRVGAGILKEFRMYEYDPETRKTLDPESGATIRDLRQAKDGRPPERYFEYRCGELSFKFGVKID